MVTGLVLEPELGEELHPLKPARMQATKTPQSKRHERRRTKGKRKMPARETISNRAIAGIAPAAVWGCEVEIVRTEAPLPGKVRVAGAKLHVA